jgi:predicted TIM-barrel fold metal-dependent hydrolase
MTLTPGATAYVGSEPADIATDLLLRHQDRILFGSDFPLNPYPYGEEYRWLEERGLPDDVKRKILTSNAVQWLDLPG